MTRPPTNRAASVRARLLAKANVLGENFDFVLRRYGVECVLRRLVSSQHAGGFVLKGAMLFLVWTGQISRPTRDLDLLGTGQADPARLADVFRDLCQAAADDGVEFLAATVLADAIAEGTLNRGVRVRFEGRLDGARMYVQVDVGFGDAVVPPAEMVEFPSLLGGPGPRILAYPREAMVAEKLHAIVSLGEGNSRMKDFHDIVVLSETYVFDGLRLSQALAATFEQRGTPVLSASTSAPPFFADPTRSTRWQRFRLKLESELVPQDFSEVGERLQRFLGPVMEAVHGDSKLDLTWPPGGPWR